MRVNGQNVLSLIDSGSEMSLISASLVRMNDLSRTQQMLKAANGTSIKVLGEVEVTCELEDTTFVVPCLVTEQLSEMILGLEWLERQKAVWNFDERWIQLQGQRFSLYSMPRGSKCRKVVVAYDVQIPAMSESDVEVYAILPDLLPDECTLDMENSPGGLARPQRHRVRPS
jgi:hypothetical protein